jgi:hypothetical protein
MAAQNGDPEAMHLFQLIGAPLLAVIQAEAQAAQTSAEYIQRVGFDPKPEKKPDLDQLHNAGNIDQVRLGPMKMASFSVDRRDADGNIQQQEVSIPVLSLFPVPMLQVKDAEFNFSVRVVTRVPLQSADDKDQTLGHDSNKDFLAPERVELKGMLAPKGAGGERLSAMNIDIKIRMEQSDMPAGLMKLMNLMDHSASSKPKRMLTEEPAPEAAKPEKPKENA